MRLLAAAILGLVVSSAATAAQLHITGELVQGGLVMGKAVPGASVSLDGRALLVAGDGTFVFGLGRDAPARVTLTMISPGGRSETRNFVVRQRKYKVQRIDGLPPGKVEPSPQDMQRIRADGALIRAARARKTGRTWFQDGFAWPVVGRVSGVFGSLRILNGKPRQPHSGTDVAAPKGTPVLAPAAAVVAMARTGMFFTGGTVVLDHGMGVNTIYAHMSKVLVRDGQKVARGEPIGRVGATGRVTGAHLHWGASWFQTRLDPELLAGPMPR
jgi:murein DD-endopeptidase MepM/ murein hydrolase activator NlpD